MLLVRFSASGLLVKFSGGQVRPPRDKHASVAEQDGSGQNPGLGHAPGLCEGAGDGVEELGSEICDSAPET